MNTEKLTAMQELIELRNKSFDVIKFVKWFDENKNYILEKEKQQIIDTSEYKIKAVINSYKECFELFIPIEKWDEATEFLSTYNNGLAKDLKNKER